MNAVINLADARPATVDTDHGWKVDTTRGANDGRVSRPADERYLSLASLYDYTRARSEASFARNVETRELRVIAALDDAERMRIAGPDCGHCDYPQPMPADANARLIAAAPELYEALRDVLPYARACIGSTWLANPPQDSVIVAAEAALAKADGHRDRLTD